MGDRYRRRVGCVRLPAPAVGVWRLAPAGKALPPAPAGARLTATAEHPQPSETLCGPAGISVRWIQVHTSAGCSGASGSGAVRRCALSPATPPPPPFDRH